MTLEGEVIMENTKPFNIIYEAEWNDIPCADYPMTPDIWASQSIRPLVNNHVDTLFYNLCSSDGYVCELKNGQLLMDNFETLGDAWVWRYRENTKHLVNHDANPPDLAVKYGRRLGIKVLPVVRMNDPHDQFYKYEVSTFKFENPHLLIGSKTGYMDWEKGARGHPNRKSIDCFTWGLFDFAHQEVRDHKFAIIEEFITRWDNDGVSLDFERDPYLFAEQGLKENAEIITDLVRKVRKTLDTVAAERGKKQFLHVRVLPEIGVSYERGLDVKRWVDEGLVDAVSPGAGYLTFSQDLSEWKKLTEGKNCWVYPCINHWRTPEVTRAWAKLMYRRGADGLYLFNWGHLLHGFGKNTPAASERQGTVDIDEVNPLYYEALSQIGNSDTIAYQNSTYELETVSHEIGEGNTGANNRIYRAIDAVELPIELSIGKHSVVLPFAEDIADAVACGYSPRITLRMKIENYTYPDEFDSSINGKLLDPSKRTARAVFIMNNDTWVTHPVEPGMLKIGRNDLTVKVAKLNPQMSVKPVLRNIELVVEY